MVNEQSLIKDVINGEDSKFSLLFNQNKEIVFKAILIIIKDNNVASDILQETFIKAHHNLKKFNNKSKFSTWLLRIAYNLCYDYLKREKKRKSVYSNLPLPKDDFVTSDYDKIEFRNKIIYCIYELPIAYRDTLFLFYVNEKNYKEISLDLEIPIGTVKTYLNRGKQILHLKLKRIYEKGIK